MPNSFWQRLVIRVAITLRTIAPSLISAIANIFPNTSRTRRILIELNRATRRNRYRREYISRHSSREIPNNNSSSNQIIANNNTNNSSRIISNNNPSNQIATHPDPNIAKLWKQAHDSLYDEQSTRYNSLLSTFIYINTINVRYPLIDKKNIDTNNTIIYIFLTAIIDINTLICASFQIFNDNDIKNSIKFVKKYINKKNNIIHIFIQYFKKPIQHYEIYYMNMYKKYPLEIFQDITINNKLINLQYIVKCKHDESKILLDILIKKFTPIKSIITHIFELPCNQALLPYTIKLIPSGLIYCIALTVYPISYNSPKYLEYHAMQQNVLLYLKNSCISLTKNCIDDENDTTVPQINLNTWGAIIYTIRDTRGRLLCRSDGNLDRAVQQDCPFTLCYIGQTLNSFATRYRNRKSFHHHPFYELFSKLSPLSYVSTIQFTISNFERHHILDESLLQRVIEILHSCPNTLYIFYNTRSNKQRDTTRYKPPRIRSH